MLECIKLNIEIIKLLLYIFQIFIIGIGIYVGYRNYKELIRKNTIEEKPYVRINKEKNVIKIKNYGKTPVIINLDNFYTNDDDSKKNNYKKKIINERNYEIHKIIESIEEKLPEKLMQDEEIVIKFNNISLKHDLSFNIGIHYENHVEKVHEVLNIKVYKLTT